MFNFKFKVRKALFDLLDLGAHSLKYPLDCSKKEKKRDVGVQKLSARSRDSVNTQTFLAESIFYYINNNEIPGKLSRENLISSDVKITCYLHM